MGFVVRCDTELDDAYLEYDFAAQSEVYLTVDATFDAAALAAWQAANFSGDLLAIFGAGGYLGAIDFNSPPDLWIDAKTGQTNTSPTPTADTTYTFECHYQEDAIVESWVNGTQVGNDSTLGDGPATVIRVGQYGAPNDPDAIVVIDNVKLGTSRGGTELFSDDFDDGTFDAWTSTYGDVTLVGSSDLTRRVVLGMQQASVMRRTSVFFDNVKVGSTLGGTDYIDNDFTGGF